MKSVLIIRTNKVEPDPRVEKEANALCNTDWLDVSVLAWDRDAKYHCRKEKLVLKNRTIPIIRFGIPAQWGNGMKSNLIPAIKYEVKLFFWLLRNIRKYDCIHACDLMTGLPALLPVKLFKKKIVYDCCDYYADSQHAPECVLKIIRKLESMVIEHSDATILCSEKRLKQIYPAQPKEVFYIHNSPDIDSYNVNDGTDKICKSTSHRLKLVYVGNFCSDRWLIELLENVAKLSDTVEMHIGGFGGLEDRINELARKNKNIYVYGKLAYSEVLRLEKECDVITALYETHLKNHVYAAPNKFYEALALGKPLLMLKGSGMSEIVEEEHIGSVIEPTFDSFVRGLDEIRTLLIDSKNLSSKMNKLFLDKYNWSIMENELINLYQQVLGY